LDRWELFGVEVLALFVEWLRFPLHLLPVLRGRAGPCPVPSLYERATLLLPVQILTEALFLMPTLFKLRQHPSPGCLFGARIFLRCIVTPAGRELTRFPPLRKTRIRIGPSQSFPPHSGEEAPSTEADRMWSWYCSVCFAFVNFR